MILNVFNYLKFSSLINYKLVYSCIFRFLFFIYFTRLKTRCVFSFSAFSVSSKLKLNIKFIKFKLSGLCAISKAVW